jgi:CRP-like cAMP-binding protein
MFNGLGAGELAALAPHCRRVRLLFGQVLSRPDEPMAHGYFPEHGFVSVVSEDRRGERTEICLIGPEGFCAPPLVLDDDRWPYRCVVQMADVTAIRIDGSALRAAMDNSPALRRRLLRGVQAQWVQVAEGLVSAAWQRIPARLARWLLMCRDRSGSDQIETTHEFTALMVGAQRPGITVALHDLEGRHLIAATRGRVLIRDPAGLERVADGSYGTAEREQARLLGHPD